jgi:hypothetical protein
MDKPHVSVIAADLTPGYLFGRAQAFLKYFILVGLGLDLSRIPFAIKLTGLVIALAVLLRWVRVSDSRTRFWLVALLPYLFSIYLLLPPNNPRYLLILVPLAALLVAATVHSVEPPALRVSLFGALCLLLLVHSSKLAYELKSVPTPPISIIEFIRDHYDAERTVLIRQGSWARHLDYYGEGLEIKNGGIDCSWIESVLTSGVTVLTVEACDSCPEFGCKKIFEARRDPRVHWKHHKLSLYAYTQE